MIYFVQAEDGGPIKIGFTETPSIRFASLAAEIETRLVILGVVNGTRDTEKSFHDRFSPSRLKGEWFHPTEDLLDFINEETSPWDGVDENAPRSLVSFRGSEDFEKWLDGLVDHAHQGTRTLLLKNALREFGENHGYKPKPPKR